MHQVLHSILLTLMMLEIMVTVLYSQQLGGGLFQSNSSTNGVDIYTYKTFDGGTTWYAFVIGQNFA